MTDDPREREPGIVLDPKEVAEFGPAMMALPNDRWRLFVVALYRVPPGRGFGVRSPRRLRDVNDAEHYVP